MDEVVLSETLAGPFVVRDQGVLTSLPSLNGPEQQLTSRRRLQPMNAVRLRCFEHLKGVGDQHAGLPDGLRAVASRPIV